MDKLLRVLFLLLFVPGDLFLQLFNLFFDPLIILLLLVLDFKSFFFFFPSFLLNLKRQSCLNFDLLLVLFLKWLLFFKLVQLKCFPALKDSWHYCVVGWLGIGFIVLIICDGTMEIIWIDSFFHWFISQAFPHSFVKSAGFRSAGWVVNSYRKESHFYLIGKEPRLT